MSRRRCRNVATILATATAFACVGCSSNGSNDSPTVSPSPPPTGGCAAIKNLMQVEQVVIHDLQVGKVNDATAEATITGVNAQLSKSAEEAGSTSILGITLTQLVQANGTMSQALNQSVPVANLDSLIGRINQDVTNVENNCHAP